MVGPSILTLKLQMFLYMHCGRMRLKLNLSCMRCTIKYDENCSERVGLNRDCFRLLDDGMTSLEGLLNGSLADGWELDGVG